MEEMIMKNRIFVKLYALLLTAALSLSAFTGCATPRTDDQGAESSSAAANAEIVNAEPQPVVLSENIVSDEDSDSGWDASATKINLVDDTISVEGTGAQASGNVVEISAAGTYVVNGALTDGQILIAAANTDVVRVVLNGANITNKSGAPIYAAQCDKLIIILADGTTNTVTDGGDGFVYANATDEEPNAAVFAKDDLTINGSGSLTVNAGFNNGIGTKDDLLIVSGKLNVTAANNGIRGNDSVTVFDGDFTIDAGGDGIQSSNSEKTDKGVIEIQGGTFAVTSAHDGIQAENSLMIFNGAFDITTGGGSANAPVQEEGFGGGRGAWGGDTETQTEAASETETTSMKALKAVNELQIFGGEFNIDAEDDAVHSNGNVSVEQGILNIKSGDDGFHADNTMNISGGTINIPVCYEGIEGLSVTISGGDITVNASDDAINAAGGVDNASAFGGPMGADSFESDGERFVRISGGTLDLYAPHDGIDSNGDVFFEGGTVKISGPSQGAEGAIDLDGAMTVTGGELITAGSVLSPSGDSTQPVLLVSYTAQQNSGSVIAIMDATGNTLLEYTAKTAFTLSGFTSPAFNIGDTVSLYIDGEKRADVTLTAIVTSVGDDGGEYSGRGGRGGGMGGGMDRGQPPEGGGFGGGMGGGTDRGQPPSGDMVRPGGGFPAIEGLDEESVRAVMEIIRTAQDGALTDEAMAKLREIGLTDEQISQMLNMVGSGNRRGREGQPDTQPGAQPGA
jgi:hypothetical protein